MKTEIIFPTIERWHCVDLILRNLEEAERPDPLQILTCISGGQEYAAYVTKRLKDIVGAENLRVIRKQSGYDHDALREEYYDLPENQRPMKRDIRTKKLEEVYDTYQRIVDQADPNVDYYWFIEDDTLFPLDVLSRYKRLMEAKNADIVTGISYYWHTGMNHERNFWHLAISEVFPGEESSETTFSLAKMNNQESGIVKLGATGLGNVLCKREAVEKWKPKMYTDIGSGADISFFLCAKKHNLSAYGAWGIYLPHITKYANGDIEVRGRIDKSLIPIINAGYSR